MTREPVAALHNEASITSTFDGVIELYSSSQK